MPPAGQVVPPEPMRLRGALESWLMALAAGVGAALAHQANDTNKGFLHHVPPYEGGPQVAVAVMRKLIAYPSLAAVLAPFARAYQRWLGWYADAYMGVWLRRGHGCGTAAIHAWSATDGQLPDCRLLAKARARRSIR